MAERHLKFLLTIEISSDGRIVDDVVIGLLEAIQITSKTVSILKDCIAETFALFSLEKAASRALQCMAQAKEITSKLLSDKTRRRIFNCKKNLIVF